MIALLPKPVWLAQIFALFLSPHFVSIQRKADQLVDKYKPVSNHQTRIGSDVSREEKTTHHFRYVSAWIMYGYRSSFVLKKDVPGWN